MTLHNVATLLMTLAFLLQARSYMHCLAALRAYSAALRLWTEQLSELMPDSKNGEAN